MEKLKPCPRCESPVLICEEPQGRSADISWGFACTNRECPLVSLIIAPTRDKAIAAWNSRPQSEIERLAREVVRVLGGWHHGDAMTDALDALAAAVKEADRES